MTSKDIYSAYSFNLSKFTRKFLFFLILVLLCLTNISSKVPEEIRKKAKLDKIQIIAHRGLSGEYPEHSLRSFQEAYKLDIDYLEVDINVTKDDVLVVAHDAWLNLYTNVDQFPSLLEKKRDSIVGHDDVKDGVFIVDFNWQELSEVRHKQRFDSRSSEYDNQEILISFETFLLFLTEKNKKSNRNIGVYVEAKSTDWYHSQGKDLNTLIKNMLKKFKLNDYNNEEWNQTPVIMQTFDESSMVYFNPESGHTNIPLVSLNSWKSFNYFSWQATFVDAISIDLDILLFDRIDDYLISEGKAYRSKDEFIKKVVENKPQYSIDIRHNMSMGEKYNIFKNHLKNLGMEIVVYTMRDDIHKLSINPKEEYTTLYNMGVKGFFTDFSRTAIEALKDLREKEKE